MIAEASHSQVDLYEAVRHCYENDGWSLRACAGALGITERTFRQHVSDAGWITPEPERRRAARRMAFVRARARADGDDPRAEEARAALAAALEAEAAAARAAAGEADEPAPGAPEVSEPEDVAEAFRRLGDSLRRVIAGKLHKLGEAGETPEPGAALSVSHLTRSLKLVRDIEEGLLRLKEGDDDRPSYARSPDALRAELAQRLEEMLQEEGADAPG